MGLNFEWTIKAGDILTMLGAFVVAAGILYRRGGQEAGVRLTLEALTRELTEMKTEFKSFGEILKKVAIQEMQIGLLMKWYDELRRGKGRIVDNDEP